MDMQLPAADGSVVELKGQVFEDCGCYPDVVEFSPGHDACLAWGMPLDRSERMIACAKVRACVLSIS